MKIFVATHKECTFPADTGYIPIQNGRAISEHKLDMQGDDRGCSISYKMPYYSECCALYWILNNCDDEFLGLMHYRRFFAHKEKYVEIDGKKIAASDDFDELAQFDLVVCDNRILENNQTVMEQYATCHYLDDLMLLRRIVAKIYPNYLATFDAVMNECNITLYNMFVGRSDVMKIYSDWLFSILLLSEDWISYREYNYYQKRVFAFFSERLFTVWLTHNRLNIRITRRPMIFLSF